MPFCDKLDKDRNGHLDIFALGSLLAHFFTKYEECHNLKMSSEERKELEEKIQSEMDFDGYGTIDQLELKVFLTRKYNEMFRKTKA